MTSQATASQKIYSIESLRFVKLKLPRLIPESLVEAVKGRTFSPEEFYEYQEKQVDNQNNLLYVLIDEAKKIHGYLWAELNILDGSLFINTFSISKEYWGKGSSIKYVVEFLRLIKDQTKAPRVFWITTNPKFFSKMGFKPSKNVIMEFPCAEIKEAA